LISRQKSYRLCWVVLSCPVLSDCWPDVERDLCLNSGVGWWVFNECKERWYSICWFYFPIFKQSIRELNSSTVGGGNAIFIGCRHWRRLSSSFSSAVQVAWHSGLLVWSSFASLLSWVLPRILPRIPWEDLHISSHFVFLVTSMSSHLFNCGHQCTTHQL
jgi:hypothetical protein